MRFHQFAPNLFISNDPSFCDYNREIVHHLITSVDIDFSICLGILPFKTCDCFIMYHPDHPMCCPSEKGHLIYLHAYQDYWCRWVYQFAHEYCHHFINGKLSREISGLTWFEETICELSSMFHLYRFYARWSKKQHPYAPFVLDYLNDLLSKNPLLFSETLRPRFLSLWEQILSEPKYHRDHYNVIATKMFPLFVENPRLWKIILHFGDMRKWNSLPDLFEHLHQTADDSYSQSLSDLEKLLLS